MKNNLVLSLFSGIDLLGMAFREIGFCVVSAGDIAFGSDIRNFHAPAGHFNGVILGSPCQAWSTARRGRVSEEEKAAARSLIAEGARVIIEAQPDWWLWENVPSVPSIRIEGYTHQRFDLTHAEYGGVMLRRRHFQFGVKTIWNLESIEWFGQSGSKLILPRAVTESLQCCCNHYRAEHVYDEACLKCDCVAFKNFIAAPVGERSLKTPWPDLCRMFDLTEGFEFGEKKRILFSTRGKYLAVRNGVPLRMGRVIATAIKNLMEGNQPATKICVCGCGRVITGKQSLATPACRKRMERWRKGTGQETLYFK